MVVVWDEDSGSSSGANLEKRNEITLCSMPWVERTLDSLDGELCPGGRDCRRDP